MSNATNQKAALNVADKAETGVITKTIRFASNRRRLFVARILVIMLGLLGGSVIANAQCDKECCAGRVLFNATDLGAKLSPLAESGLADRRWTHIVPGQFTADSLTDVFFYDKNRQIGQFFRLNTEKAFVPIGGSYSSSGNTWDVIVPGKFGAHDHTDLFLYDRKLGVAAFAITDGLGDLLISKRISGLRKSWDLIVPGQYGGDSQTDLLFYDRAAGLVEFYVSEGESSIGDGKGGSGPFSTLTSLRKTWTLIIPGQFGGDLYTDLLFYDRAEGTGQFYVSDGLGHIGDGKGGSGAFKDYAGGLSKSWDMIIPGNFGSALFSRVPAGSGLTDLLFYDRGAKDLEFWGLDSVANIFQFAAYPAILDWGFVVPGIFKPRLAPIEIPCDSCFPSFPPVIRPLEDLFFYDDFVCPSPPKAPSAVKARRTAVTDTEDQIALSWQDNSDNEIGFQISVNGKSICVPPETKRWTITGLSPKSIATIRVGAIGCDLKEYPSPSLTVAETEKEFAVFLKEQMMHLGIVPYTATYPAAGTLDGYVKKISVPPNPLGAIDFAVAFVKSGWNTDNCGDSSKYILLRQGESTSDMKVLFGTDKPIVVMIAACYQRISTSANPMPDTVVITVTVRSNDTLVSTPVLLFGVTCPGDIATETPPGETSVIVGYSPATTTDPLNDIVSCSPASGSRFPIGTTIVTCIADDGLGGTSACSFSVAVSPPNNKLTLDCPADVVTATGEGESSVIVNYTVPQANIVHGTTVSCAPPPGVNFPIGVTPVVCSAINTSGQSAACSFAVTVRANRGLDICLQDESNSNTIQINSATGEYQFRACGTGFVLNGMGNVSQRGGVLVLQDNQTDRRILARVDAEQSKGSASVEVLSSHSVFTITDRNIGDSNCVCP